MSINSSSLSSISCEFNVSVSQGAHTLLNAINRAGKYCNDRIDEALDVIDQAPTALGGYRISYYAKNFVNFSVADLLVMHPVTNVALTLLQGTGILFPKGLTEHCVCIEDTTPIKAFVEKNLLEAAKDCNLDLTKDPKLKEQLEMAIQKYADHQFRHFSEIMSLAGADANLLFEFTTGHGFLFSGLAARGGSSSFRTPLVQVGIPIRALVEWIQTSEGGVEDALDSELQKIDEMSRFGYGHEFSHITHNDRLKKYSIDVAKCVATIATLIINGSFDPFVLLSSQVEFGHVAAFAVGRLFETCYDLVARTHERRADRYACELLQDTKGGEDFFEFFMKVAPINASFIHPDHEERLEAVKELKIAQAC